MMVGHDARASVRDRMPRLSMTTDGRLRDHGHPGGPDRRREPSLRRPRGGDPLRVRLGLALVALGTAIASRPTHRESGPAI